MAFLLISNFHFILLNFILRIELDIVCFYRIISFSRPQGLRLPVKCLWLFVQQFTTFSLILELLYFKCFKLLRKISVRLRIWKIIKIPLLRHCDVIFCLLVRYLKILWWGWSDGNDPANTMISGLFKQLTQ